MTEHNVNHRPSGFLERRLIDFRNYIFGILGLDKNSTIRAYGNEFVRHDPRLTSDMRRGLEFQFYEREEISLISKHILPGDRVLELGVGMGVTSVYMAGIVGPENMRLYDIDPENIALAKRNFALNGLSLQCRQSAVVSGANAPSTLKVASNVDPLCSSTVNIERPGMKSVYTVETCRFEEVCAEFAPTALVIDIEGGEYDLITRATDFGGIVKILIELHRDVIGEEKAGALLARLESEGFRIADMLKDGEVVALLREPPGQPEP